MQVDGFWGMRISRPFRRKRPEVLKMLKVLLDAVMIRHSKSQTYLDGRSILDLPGATNRVVAVDMPSSERYIVMYLEMHAVKDIRDMFQRSAAEANGGNGNGNGNGVSTTRANFWLRVLRETCIAPSLINGGANCTPQLREIDARLRSVNGFWALSGLLGGRQDAAGREAEEIRSMTPSDALRVLMQARDVKDTSRHHNSHMVRHDAAHQGVYDRSRAYAMPTVQERLGEVTSTKEELEACISGVDRAVPHLRWKMAVDAITSGRYMDLTRSSLGRLFVVWCVL
jgi:hypothetical protein